MIDLTITPVDFWVGFLMAITAHVIATGIRIYIRERACRMF